MTQTPDGVPCRHCGRPIFWDEICWVHDNGFADCQLVIGGGDGKTNADGSMIMLIDPQIVQDPDYKGKRALPVGEWT